MRRKAHLPAVFPPKRRLDLIARREGGAFGGKPVSPLVVAKLAGGLTRFSIDGGLSWAAGSALTNDSGSPKQNIIYDGGSFWTCSQAGVSANRRLWTSVDGQTWSNTGVATNDNTVQLSFGLDTYVMLGTTGLVWRISSAPDGLTWTLRSNTIANNNISGHAFNGNAWVGGGRGGPTFNAPIRSTNGTAWGLANPFPGANEAMPVIAARKSDGLFVGANGTTFPKAFYSSDDGLSFQTAALAVGRNNAEPWTIACNGTYFCFSPAGNNTATYITSDGANWVAGAGFAHDQFQCLCWSPSINSWLAGCTNAVFASSDGLVWSQVAALSAQVVALCATTVLPL
jgi:hypothetical protein